MQNLTENPIIEEVLRRYVVLAERVITREVQAQGLVLTGEMLASIRASAVEKGAGFIQASVHFETLLRIKDMKTLNYSRMPPLSAMKKFVEKVGLENFGQVPGYPAGVSKLSHEKQIERVAWAVRHVYKQEPNVKRGYRGVYNDPIKNEILPNFFYELRQHAGMTALTELRAVFNEIR